MYGHMRLDYTGEEEHQYWSRLLHNIRYYSGDSLITPLVLLLCIFFPFILDIKVVGRTSRGHTGGRSHRIYHPPSFCGACPNFFIFFHAKRIQPFLSLVDREVEFCVLTI